MPLPLELLRRECSFPHRLNICNNDNSKSELHPYLKSEHNTAPPKRLGLYPPIREGEKQRLWHIEFIICPQICSLELEAVASRLGGDTRTREKGETRRGKEREGKDAKQIIQTRHSVTFRNRRRESRRRAHRVSLDGVAREGVE